MIIAAIYPVFLWFMVFRFRRTWLGAAIAIVGTLLVLPIGLLTQRISGATTGFVLSRIIYGEMTLIGIVSAWLATMRRAPGNPVCPYCKYDVTGLSLNPGTVCPECGNELIPGNRDPREPYCLCCGQKLGPLNPSVPGQTCPSCGAGEVDFGNWGRARVLREQARAKRDGRFR
ncbi:MAG: hypothetical protein QM783_12145 [Phycisphaerales bacterium]